MTGEISKARYADRRKIYPSRRDDEGHWLCAWCGKILTGRKRRYCGAACMTEVDIRCGFGIRSSVARRDKGICARCGRNIERLETAIRHIRAFVPHLKDSAFAESLGLKWGDLGKSLWEAHHTTAVQDGGGACPIEGYETLCIWCHRSETGKRAGDKAKARRVDRQDQLPLLKANDT